MKTVDKKIKTAICIPVVFLLFLTGVTYGGWTDTLSIRGIFTTANFSVEFGDKNDIEVYLITLDSQNDIKVEEKIENINITKNDNKNIALSIKGNLTNKLKEDGYMLQVIYPLRTRDDSKIKAIRNIKADFDKPDQTIEAIPKSVKIILEDEQIEVNEEISESNYKIRFNVYRRIETEDDKSSAVIFLEADRLYALSNDILSVDYLKLTEIFPEYTDKIPYDNPVVGVQLEAEYSLKIPIVTEQFNAGQLNFED